MELVTLTHADVTTEEFDALSRAWLASARHPRFGRLYPATVYQPMLELLSLLDGSRIGPAGPELLKSRTIQVINDGPQKPGSIHRHIGQRPIVAAGNTDGDLPMLQWSAASPHRTLELVVHHTDGDREYAYDRDPILGSGTG